MREKRIRRTETDYFYEKRDRKKLKERRRLQFEEIKILYFEYEAGQ